MAFVKTLASMFPTLGSPNFAGPPAITLAAGGNTGTNAQAIGVVTAGGGGSQTVTFNTFPGPGTITRGWIRVKTTSLNAATTSATFLVKGTDGTTTQFFYQSTNPLPGAAGSQSIDAIVPFMSDLNLTSVIVIVTTVTNAGTFDVEICANV